MRVWMPLAAMSPAFYRSCPERSRHAERGRGVDTETPAVLKAVIPESSCFPNLPLVCVCSHQIPFLGCLSSATIRVLTRTRTGVWRLPFLASSSVVGLCLLALRFSCSWETKATLGQVSVTDRAKWVGTPRLFLLKQLDRGKSHLEAASP